MTDIKEIIAERLRNARAEQGWSSEDVGQHLGLKNKSRYTNWELAYRAPKADDIFALAKLFRKSPAWIAGLSNKEREDTFDHFRPKAMYNTLSSNVTLLSEEQHRMMYHLSYAKKRGLNPDHALQVPALDDSMKPLINAKDDVLIDESKKEVTNKDIFAINVNGVAWFRWITPQITNGYIISSEDDNNYPDQHIKSLSEINIIGRVIRIAHDR